MGHLPVVNIPGSGSDHQRPRGAYSMSLATFPALSYLLISNRRALSTECKDAGLNVYVASDGSDVYEARFRQIASAGTGVIHPTLILLGIRLGIDRVTPAYWEALKAVLQYPQSVCIAG